MEVWQQEPEVEDSCLQPETQNRENELKLCEPSHSQSLPPVMYLLQQGQTSLASPNSAMNWGPTIQIPESKGDIFIICFLYIGIVYRNN